MNPAYSTMLQRTGGFRVVNPEGAPTAQPPAPAAPSPAPKPKKPRAKKAVATVAPAPAAQPPSPTDPQLARIGAINENLKRAYLLGMEQMVALGSTSSEHILGFLGEEEIAPSGALLELVLRIRRAE